MFTDVILIVILYLCYTTRRRNFSYVCWFTNSVHHTYISYIYISYIIIYNDNDFDNDNDNDNDNDDSNDCFYYYHIYRYLG